MTMRAVNNESEEMYLETIYLLSRENGFVHAVDIARQLDYSKPTVSERLSKLRREGLVDVEGGQVTLTNEGESEACKIYGRHTVLRDFLIDIGVNEETANTDACRIEHFISDETFDRLKEHAEAQRA